MICFLTSRTDDPITGELNPANRFIDELSKCFPEHCRVLTICSDPDDHDTTDYYSDLTRISFENAGFHFESFTILDGRNEELAEELIHESDLLILSGGHVPTQNRFFQKIGLRELIKDFDGIVIGISAGSMNSADVVYARAELEGEAIDPSYKKYFEGLGLTKTMLLPHHQDVRDVILDGLRLFEDITCSDSYGKTFYSIPDGSYLYIDSSKEELRGEAYMIKDGVMKQISSDGETVVL